jgi:hypothetical protein
MLKKGANDTPHEYLTTCSSERQAALPAEDYEFVSKRVPRGGDMIGAFWTTDSRLLRIVLTKLDLDAGYRSHTQCSHRAQYRQGRGAVSIDSTIGKPQDGDNTEHT